MAPRKRPLSFVGLGVFGAAVIGIGLYFLVLRPPLLPEDLRYLGLSATEVETSVPRLTLWLSHVFTVMGGYILAAGLLVIAFAATSFRERRRGALAVAAVAGLASIGTMAGVNFVIDSDFKWVLLAIALLWAASLGLYIWEGRRSSPALRGRRADVPESR